MARLLVIGPYAASLRSFRGDLMKEFNNIGYEVFAVAPEKGYEEDLKEIGVTYINLPMERTATDPLKDLNYLVALIRLIRKIKPDTVFCYAVKPVIYGSLAVSITGRFRRISVFSMVTGLGFVFIGNSFLQRTLRPIIKLMYKFALQKNQRVFFQNPDDLKAFVEMGLVNRGKSVLVNGSGVDTEKYSLAETKTEPLSFLLIARIIKDKGILEYIEAARIIKERYPEVKVKILGPYDPNPSAIKPEELKQWISGGCVEYLGETDDVRPFIKETSVYVLPSYREGTPRSVLEAMSMGRPVITTDAPGCRETVRHGYNGFLVPIKDSQSLAEAMEKFIKNPELIAEMGKRSRELAEEKYDVRKVNQVILRAMGLEAE